MHHIGTDAAYLPGQCSGPQHLHTMHRRGDVQRRRALQFLREPSEIPQAKHVALKALAIAPQHYVGQDTLHPAVVQILNDMQHSEAMRHQRPPK